MVHTWNLCTVTTSATSIRTTLKELKKKITCDSYVHPSLGTRQLGKWTNQPHLTSSWENRDPNSMAQLCDLSSVFVVPIYIGTDVVKFIYISAYISVYIYIVEFCFKFPDAGTFKYSWSGNIKQWNEHWTQSLKTQVGAWLIPFSESASEKQRQSHLLVLGGWKWAGVRVETPHKGPAKICTHVLLS